MQEGVFVGDARRHSAEWEAGSDGEREKLGGFLGVFVVEGAPPVVNCLQCHDG